MSLYNNQGLHTITAAVLVCGLLALCGTFSVAAQWMDGENLARVCDPEQQGHIFRPGMCAGYIMAAIDLEEELAGRDIIAKPRFCMPEDVPIPRVTSLVTGYIKAHPDRLHENAGMLVIDALSAAFPCQH